MFHNDRTWFLRLLDDFIEALVRDDREPVDRSELFFILSGHARPIGKAQATSECLLGKDVRGRCPKGDDRVEIGDVPAFFQLVHMDDDLGSAVGFQRDEPFHRLLCFLRLQ